MSYASSSEMSRENLLPVEEQEKDDMSFKKPNPLIRLYRVICKPRFCKNGISILQQIIITLIFITLLHIAYIQGLGRPMPRSHRSFVPQIPAAAGPIKFKDSADWSGNTTRAASFWKKWLVNFDTHTIAIPKSQIEEFGYEPGLNDFADAHKDYERFGIAMFHQLHCLATIREFAYMPDAQRMPNGKPLDHDGVTFSPLHMDHCFNYLRQSIECFSDSTVEWAKIDEQDGRRQGIQGWGIPHYECRDRDALEAFALEHNNM